MSKNGRDRRGKFVAGGPPGPGRPRRLTESHYLAKLSEAISLNDWQQIVRKAKEDAINGDWRARSWLSDYLLGREPKHSLHDLAVREQSGETLDADVKNEALGIWPLPR